MYFMTKCFLLLVLVFFLVEGWRPRKRNHTHSKSEDNISSVIEKHSKSHGKHHHILRLPVNRSSDNTEAGFGYRARKARRRKTILMRKKTFFKPFTNPCYVNSSCSCAYNSDSVLINCYNLTTIKSLLDAVDSKNHTNMTINHLFVKNSSFDSFPDDFLAGRSIQRLILRNVTIGLISLYAFRGIHDLYEIITFNLSVPHVPNIFKPAGSLVVVRMERLKVPEFGTQLANISSLKVVHLSHNNLSHIDENAFENLWILKALDLSHNLLKSIPPRTFRDLHNIIQLSLQGNLLTTFHGVFEPISSTLQKLSLSFNQLESLESILYKKTSVLRSLSICNNKLKVLRSEDFKNKFPHLMSLYVCNNPLEEVEPGVLQWSFVLETIDLRSNLITKLSPDTFAHHLNLLRIEIENNRITDPKGFFVQAKNLKFLHLNKNDIVFINDTFKDIPQIVDLSLESNKITRLVNNTFINNSRLRYLSLKFNQISYLEVDAFKGLKTLLKLYISHNRITNFNGALQQLPRVQLIDLGNNSLTRLTEKDFSGRLNIIKLSLKHNRLTEVNGAFRQLKTLSELDLNTNLIEVLTEESFPQEAHLKKFYIQNNPLQCDCRLGWIKKKMYRKKIYVYHDTSCQGPTRLHKQQIRWIPTRFFYDWPDDCPKGCSCFCQPNGTDYVIHVKCSEGRIEHFPVSFPNKTVIVNVSNNGLRMLPKNLSSLLPSLEDLDMERNNISSLSGVDFPATLMKLRLAENQMTVFDGSLNKMSLGLITTSQNPWRCDCFALKLRTWLIKNSRAIVDINETKCSSDNSVTDIFKNKVIIRLDEKDLCPATIALYTVIIIVLLGCVLMGTSLFITYIRYRMPIKVWLYTRGLSCVKREDIDEDKLFDAFLAFSAKDHDLAEGLANRLERSPHPNYRLCLHYRDFIAGNYIMDNINWAVESSKKTIVLLSSHFIQSSWPLEEFKAAHRQMMREKINRIILVIIGDLPSKEEIGKDLQAYLISSTYLKWDDPYFWEKLLYEMPKVAMGCHNRVTVSEGTEGRGHEDTDHLLTAYL